MIQILRWLLKPKLHSKCVYYVKCIKTRLETIQKKRRFVQNFTKSDIAELLRRGRDYDAYKRTEWLLSEERMLSCYEFIEKFIECISDHLEELTKQSDCPEECKEAIPSLIYAAARIYDLPELRDLRTVFTEKYENSLEPYINKEFVEKLKRDPATREMKIKLLYDIAKEFSIKWNAKGLKKLLYEKSGGEEYKYESDEFDTFKENETKHQYSSDDETSSTSTDTSSTHHGRESSSSSFGSVSEDDEQKVEEEIKKPRSFLLIPPPYQIKQKTNNNSDKTMDSEVVLEKNVDPSEMKPTTSVDTTSSSKENAGAWRLPPDYDEFIARFKALTGRS